jgi:hypothetical protein
MAATDPPTERQLNYVKQLAYSRGVSFIPPTNRLQASRLIDQLHQRERSTPFEIADDRNAVVQRHGEHAPANTPRDDEIRGYGSHAHWRHSRPSGRRR